MKKSARLALAAVIFMMAGLLASSNLGSGGNSAQAQIVRQPTPNLTKILESPSPVDDDDDEDDGEDGGGDGGGSGDGGGDGGGSGGGDGGEQGDGGKDGDGKGGKDKDGEGDRTGKGSRKDKTSVLDGRGRKKGRKGKGGVDPSTLEYVAIPGAFNTDKLVSVALQLRGLEMSPLDVIQRVYPPFIIAGRASWIDTWGAPRYGPAPGQIRQHEGQDVFCDYGDPILAPENGTVSFSDGGLGGITARVHESDGSYWYMTHLSDLNTEQLSAGDSVQVGDVVGYCGNSGNAATTPPHVHIGWYQSNGAAKNPMRSLVGWLKAAERRVFGVVSKTTAKKAKQQPLFTAARRFGDDFVPVVAEFRVAGESLWASGSDPGIGATALADAALRTALSAQETDYDALTGPVGLSPEDSESVSSFLSPDSALGRLLHSRHVSANETGD